MLQCTLRTFLVSTASQRRVFKDADDAALTHRERIFDARMNILESLKNYGHGDFTVTKLRGSYHEIPL